MSDETNENPQNIASRTGLKSRLLKGFSANIYGQVVTAIVQLVGVPILLHAWGVELYGEWLIVFAIPAYLSMTDLGFSQSAANDMTAQVARNDRAGALVVFQSLIAFVYIAMLCMLALTSLLTFSLPLENWIHPAQMTISEVRWTLWFLAAAVLAQLPDGINHAGFRAGGDYALHRALHSTIRLVQFSSIWIIALAGEGPVAAAAAFCVVRGMATLALAFLLIYRQRWLRYSITDATFSELRRLFHPAMANVAIPLAQGLNIQGMILAIGAVLGSLAVVTFSTLRTLTRMVLQLVFSISHAAEPELAAAYGAGNRNLSRHLFVESLRAGLWLALMSATFLFVFGDRILAIWTHGKVQMDSVLFGWLLVSAVASVLWYSGLIVLKAANQHLRASAVFTVSAGAAVGVAVILMSWSGRVAEAGLALLLMDGAITLYILPRALKFTGVRALPDLVSLINPIGFVSTIFRALQHKLSGEEKFTCSTPKILLGERSTGKDKNL